MKKTKRLSALILASIITAGTVSSLSAGALAHWNDKEEMDKIFENAFMIPADSFMMQKSDGNGNFYDAENLIEQTYLVETEHDNIFDFYDMTGQSPDSITAKVDTDIDCEAIQKAIAEICVNSEYISVSESGDINVAGFKADRENGFYRSYEETRAKDITYDQVLEVYDFLNSTGKLQSFKYTKETANSGQTRHRLTSYRTDWKGINYKEVVENYIAEKNLDWSVLPKDSTFIFYIETGQRLSAEENYQIVEQIYNDLDIRPCIVYPASLNGSGSSTIEMHANVKGDANDDGKLALSDAIAIMQTVGNPDEYGLTAQGEYNADITGDKDGITNADALAIQRRLLGLE